jgi:DNA-binding response OmpR family regulator
MNRGKILLVDDSAEFLQVLIQRMQSRGYQAAGAAGGPEALAAVESQVFDAVVLDMMMPGMDGLETLRRLRVARPRLPVIVLTAYGTSEDVVQALDLGALDYQVKPVDLDVLLEHLDRVMAGKTPPSATPPAPTDPARGKPPGLAGLEGLEGLAESKTPARPVREAAAFAKAGVRP